MVLTSDNGFHLGQHGLGRGKGTPYDSDVHVPLLVTGPGVVPGSRTEVVSNIDLASTFEDLAGTASPALPVRHVDRADVRGPGRWTGAATRSSSTPGRRRSGFDPDRPYSGGTLDVIPSYTAVRSKDGLLVRLDLDPDWEATDIAWEFYSYAEAPYERTNRFADPAYADQVAALRQRLERFLVVSGHHA